MSSKRPYECPWLIEYHSERYDKWVTVPNGYLSDGSSGGVDVFSRGWFVHDWLCGSYLGSGPKPTGGQWDDGTPITNWQASMVLYDILKSEGRWFRARTWFAATFLFGGGKARANGMTRLKGD